MPRAKRTEATVVDAIPSWTDDEDDFWRAAHSGRAYVVAGTDYDTDYAPAYQYGVIAAAEHDGKSFDEVEKRRRRAGRRPAASPG
jgi:hypothetical protein